MVQARAATVPCKAFVEDEDDGRVLTYQNVFEKQMRGLMAGVREEQGFISFKTPDASIGC